MAIEIELENIFKDSLRNGINLFTGSEFSVLAEDGNAIKLPVGEQLKDELINEFGSDYEELKNLGLDKISSILKSIRTDDFNNYIKSRFNIIKFSDDYDVLNKFKYSNIFTTNVDNLLQKFSIIMNIFI